MGRSTKPLATPVPLRTCWHSTLRPEGKAGPRTGHSSLILHATSVHVREPNQGESWAGNTSHLPYPTVACHWLLVRLVSPRAHVSDKTRVHTGHETDGPLCDWAGQDLCPPRIRWTGSLWGRSQQPPPSPPGPPLPTGTAPAGPCDTSLATSMPTAGGSHLVQHSRAEDGPLHRALRGGEGAAGAFQKLRRQAPSARVGLAVHNGARPLFGDSRPGLGLRAPLRFPGIRVPGWGRLVSAGAGSHGRARPGDCKPRGKMTCENSPNQTTRQAAARASRKS